MIILMLFSVLAGCVTVLSPCILPILPILLSAGVGSGQYRPHGIILGLVTSFTFFTLTLGTLVQAAGISPHVGRYSAIALIIFFGVITLFPQIFPEGNFFSAKIVRLGATLEIQATKIGTGFLGGIVLGIALGLIWTPCAGPILASIITLVATQAITWHTVMITFTYALGAAIPMFLIMLGSNAIISLTGYTQFIRQCFGVLMIVGALSIAFHIDVMLQQFAVRYVPMITIEDNEMVKKELEKLHPSLDKNIRNGLISAPELVGITQWLNSEPLTLKALRGKVVLIDFWTYSCINCVRTLPHVKQWYENYNDKGFVLIGIHTPEFAFEKEISNVQAAVKRFGIVYPVAMDNDYQTWQAYSNRYWPAHYLIDQKGKIRYHHFGEGSYKKTENAIRVLLGLDALAEKKAGDVQHKQTPEIYLGYNRARHYHPTLSLQSDQKTVYDYQEPLGEDLVGLKGSWSISSEYIQSHGDDAQLSINFLAQSVFLVMGAQKETSITVLLDGKPVPPKYNTVDMEDGSLRIHEERMYAVLDLQEQSGRHTLTLRIPHEVKLYAFTFGS